MVQKQLFEVDYQIFSKIIGIACTAFYIRILRI
jgi:hypothetical protein